MQPKKAPMLKHIAEKLTKEDITAHKLNPEDKGQNATADHDEPEVIVYVPSCKRAFYFGCYLYPLPIFLSMYTHSVPGRPAFQGISITVTASVWKLYPG